MSEQNEFSKITTFELKNLIILLKIIKIKMMNLINHKF